MINIIIFNGEEPLSIKVKGTVEGFLELMSEGEIIGVQEYGTENYFFIPSTKYVIKVQEIDE